MGILAIINAIHNGEQEENMMNGNIMTQLT